MINAGANTARIQRRINNFGKAISLHASKMACAFDFFIAKCWWIFSIVTVLSSTRIPTANANPDNDIMLIVCPNSFKNNTPEMIEIGIVRITIIAALVSRKNSITIKPVSNAPNTPSIIKLFTALITYTDWSNS
ncbi:hypothetical protein D3C80_1506090 [compost metagenome]